MNLTIKNRIAQISNGEIPVGYKKTETGIVPEEWEEESLGNIFDFFGGLGIPREQLGKNGVPYLHYGDMHRENFTKAKYDTYFLRPRYDIKLKGDEHYLLKNGDMVFLDASEDLSGTSRCVVVENPTNKPFISGLHTFIAKPKNDALSLEYKQYLTEPQFVKKQFEEKSVGFKVYGMNRSSIKSVKINFPKPLTEQNRIAEILTTQDTLIEQQAKLITQKQAQKKYLMQVLLTGKKRLKGFSGEWEEKKLKNIGLLSSSGVDKKTNENDNGVFLLNYMDIYKYNFLYKNKLSMYVTATKAQCVTCNIQKGDIFFTPSSEVRNDIAHSAVMMEDCPNSVYSYHVMRLRPKITMDIAFCAYLFKTVSFYKQAYALCAGSGQRYVISLRNFENMYVSLPPLSEQEAIANILTTADQEIELLQKQLQQEKNKKKSLMQLLLTGIVRV